MNHEIVTIHGSPLSFRDTGGDGPVIVCVHGITSSSRTWERAAAHLAPFFRVIAPDLAGHGATAAPRGDYSLGAHASQIRDLMGYLGVHSATVVGHSLGGGIVLQFAYQFPDRLERLVLVDSGGLGSEVSLALRAATLPGSDVVLPLLFNPVAQAVGAGFSRVLRRVGVGAGAGGHGVREGMRSLGSPDGRRAFLATARAVIDPLGQRIDARDRLYMSEWIPSLLVWGARDPIIPLAHGREAHELMPSSRLEVFEEAGHFPHNDEPERFAALLEEFVTSTEPAVYDEPGIEQRLRHGPPA